jgi:(2Fe-2S) ferredoxin
MSNLISDPEPYFEVHVFVCVNERPADDPFGSCAAQGSQALRDHLKTRAKILGTRKVCVTASKCLSRCNQAPVMVIYPEGIWYSPKTIEDVDEIFDTHLVKGDRVERLLLR